jgi:hypothetical protein
VRVPKAQNQKGKVVKKQVSRACIAGIACAVAAGAVAIGFAQTGSDGVVSAGPPDQAAAVFLEKLDVTSAPSDLSKVSAGVALRNDPGIRAWAYVAKSGRPSALLSVNGLKSAGGCESSGEVRMCQTNYTPDGLFLVGRAGSKVVAVSATSAVGERFKSSVVGGMWLIHIPGSVPTAPGEIQAFDSAGAQVAVDDTSRILEFAAGNADALARMSRTRTPLSGP